MTFAEFKKIVIEYKLTKSDANDSDLLSVYNDWILKTWCTDIQTKHITFVRENEMLTLPNMSIDEFKSLLHLNMELLKVYKEEQKLIKMQEDFI